VVAVRLLTRLGYRADVAKGGLEAVEKATRGAYGVVLMDCQLPDIDGFRAAAEIRRREGAARRTPIVAMSASGEDRAQCLAAGLDDYVAKPVLLEELAATLARWLPDGAVLDHDRLAAFGELDADGDDPPLLTRLVDAFLAEAPADLGHLRAAVDRGDPDAVYDAAHHLKGAAATLGSAGIVDLCQRLEALACAGDLADAPALLRRLQAELPRVRGALDALVPRPPR
jgi:CheY-like chemotaxis protein/HPt (histidine-containing phosphotransfer) domain-containing protein